MSVPCPFCGKDFANTKALGSHLHYMHSTCECETNPEDARRERSEPEERRLTALFEACASDRGLKVPKNIEKVKEALEEIPRGLSPELDRYREAYSCALRKEKLVNEAEKVIREKDAD
jgi:hypothetical protein